MFLVDDNIFVRDFDMNEVTHALSGNSDAFGFSIRLDSITILLDLENKEEYSTNLGKERSWINLNYEDPNNTVKMFPINWNLKRFYFRIKRKLRNFLPFMFPRRNKN